SQKDIKSEQHECKKGQWVKLFGVMSEFRNVDFRFFQLVYRLIDLFQLCRIRSTEILAVSLRRDLLQHILVDLHFHLLLLNAERRPEWIRRHAACSNADGVNAYAECLRYLPGSHRGDGADVVHAICQQYDDLALCAARPDPVYSGRESFADGSSV